MEGKGKLKRKWTMKGHEGMEKEMKNTTSLGMKFNVAAQKGLLGVSRQQGNIIPL